MKVMHHLMLYTALPVVIASCGIDAEPGPLPGDQSRYEEPDALGCATLEGRAYAITFATGTAASDTIIFNGDRIESVQRAAMGFPASAYACSERNGNLLITAEMLGNGTEVLMWSMTVTDDAITGGVIMGEEGADAEQRFEGRALVGTNAEQRTPERKVKSY
jgi:hypothetical protein